MKLITITMIGLALLAPLAGWQIAHAQDFRSGASVHVRANETINQTLFAGASTVDIAGTVNGDVFCAGQNVTISGTVNGDVMCAGQTVTVSGTVRGSVRLAGQTVNMQGTVTRNGSIAGQSVTVGNSSKITGDLSVAGQTATMDGSVGRDVAAGSTTLAINGSVGRNVQARDGTLELGGSSAVAGSIEYASATALKRDPGARVGGTIHRTAIVTREHKRAAGFFPGGFLTLLYLFVALLVTALVLVLLLPQPFQAVTDIAWDAPLKTLLVGLVVSILWPIVVGVLFATVIGMPLAWMLLLAWALACLLSGPLAAYFIGRVILRSAGTHVVGVMALGSIVLILLLFIPIVNIIVAILALWYGLGMIALTLRHLPRPRYHVMEDDRTLAGLPSQR